MHLAQLPAPCVAATVFVIIGALAMLAAMQELSLIERAICPAHDTLAACLVLDPHALVAAAILVSVFALTICPVLVPLALIYIAIGGDELTKTVCLASYKFPIV